MTQEEIILHHRINLLLMARTIKNISKACRMFGVSRTVYYKYKNRYLTCGIYGLKDQKKAIPVMPNATKVKTVEKVLLVAKKYPTYGPARLANELGNIVCAATVYNILRRHNLARNLKTEVHLIYLVQGRDICYQLILFMYARLKVLAVFRSFVQLTQTKALE